jgi:hypothetical protein
MMEEYCQWKITISNLNDATRWVKYKKMDCQPNIKYKDAFHFGSTEQEHFLKFCPYCGRKIKFKEL